MASEGSNCRLCVDFDVDLQVHLGQSKPHDLSDSYSENWSHLCRDILQHLCYLSEIHQSCVGLDLDKRSLLFDNDIVW